MLDTGYRIQDTGYSWDNFELDSFEIISLVSIKSMTSAIVG
jgi:hypothetical protein